jgi:hypothetical protein
MKKTRKRTYIFLFAYVEIHNFFLERAFGDEVPLLIGLVVLIGQHELLACFVVVEIPNLTLSRSVDVPSWLGRRSRLANVVPIDGCMYRRDATLTENSR